MTLWLDWTKSQYDFVLRTPVGHENVYPAEKRYRLGLSLHAPFGHIHNNELCIFHPVKGAVFVENIEKLGLRLRYYNVLSKMSMYCAAEISIEVSMLTN